MTLSNFYTQAFYKSLLDGTRRSAREIVPLVLEAVHPRHVIDVGCGLGTWLAVFREQGIDDIWGIDGDWINRKELEIPEERFIQLDITKPFQLERRFDLVMSLEVAEHLPAECAESFINSITSLGNIVLFSAAIPFQGGYNHINEQWPEYWARMFKDRNYVCIDTIRQMIWRNDNVYWWYAQNILFFIKKDCIHSYPRLLQESIDKADSPLPLVHPKKYLAMFGSLT